MKKYRVAIRGQKGDYERIVECNKIIFKNSWWAVFVVEYNHRPLATGYPNYGESTIICDEKVVAAVPSEHLNLIELLEDSTKSGT